MMLQFWEVLDYILLLVFGVILAADFADVPKGKKETIALSILSLSLLFLQLVSYMVFGYTVTTRLFPLIVHLPLVIFMVKYFKLSWLTACTGLFSSYLSCQISRWIAMVFLGLLKDPMVYYIAQSLFLFPTFFLLRRYIIPSTVKLLHTSSIAVHMFTLVPFVYYLFDYITTVYTKLLYSGSAVVVEFTPFLIALCYFVLVMLYSNELLRRSRSEAQETLLAMQLNQAAKELSHVRTMDERNAVYRHDMRHHLSLISTMVEENNMIGLKVYLQDVQRDMDSLVTTVYCKNETVNLILAAFAERAKKKNISFYARANLPADISMRNTELCSLLSNSLENAITAASLVSAEKKPTVSIQCEVKNGKLMIMVQNSCNDNPDFENGLPQSHGGAEHGFGTKSILAISKKHNGDCRFQFSNGVFTVQILLPLDAYTKDSEA